MDYQQKQRYLVVVVDCRNGNLASQIMDVPFIDALRVFHDYTVRLFTQQMRKRAMELPAGVQFIPDTQVSEYLRLVEAGHLDQAYGFFVENTKKDDMGICGIYRYAQKVFKKQRIKVIKGVL